MPVTIQLSSPIHGNGLSWARMTARASENSRSLEGEIRNLLVRHARRRRLEDFRERTAQLCALTAQKPQSDSVTLLREDRAR